MKLVFTDKSGIEQAVDFSGFPFVRRARSAVGQQKNVPQD